MPEVFQHTLTGGQIEVGKKRPGPWHGVTRLQFPGGASPFPTPGEVKRDQVNWETLMRVVQAGRRVIAREDPGIVAEATRPQKRLPGF